MDFAKCLPFHVKFLLLFHTISAKFDYSDVRLRPLQDAGSPKMTSRKGFCEIPCASIKKLLQHGRPSK